MILTKHGIRKRGMIFTKYGIRKGGVCDRIHHARAARERGARMYLDELREQGCLRSDKGWFRIVRLPRMPRKKTFSIGVIHGSDVEAGYRRFAQDVIERLYKEGRVFRMAWLEKWAEDISSFEFGFRMRNPLSILDALGGDTDAVEVGYTPPHQDEIYQQRKREGEFATTAV